MKILTPEQLSRVAFKGTRTNYEVKGKAIFDEVSRLRVGEGLQIPAGDWPYKAKPSNSSLPRYVRSDGRTYKGRTSADDSSYYIIREN